MRSPPSGPSMTLSGAEALERLVVDTSAYSHLRRWHPEVERMATGAAAVLMPAIVIGELEAAFAAGTRRQANLDLLDEFLGLPFVSVYPVTRSVAARYGDLIARMRMAGTPVPVNDVWIAATTLDQDGDLLTFDRDFARIPDLRTVILATDPPTAA